MTYMQYNPAFSDIIPQSKPGPKRVLSVTGGGLLGVIPAAMLLRFETLGRATYGDDYRLCDSFDLVGGTSTGAVIATGVALGLTADEIASFYLEEAPQGFRPRRFSIPMLHDRLDETRLRSHFSRRTRDRSLNRKDLQCDLTIVAKNLCRSVPMALSTLLAGQDPRTCLGAELRGDALPLDRVLRASTAAPGLFRPEVLPLGDDGADDVFIDGGLSPFNNPALLLARLAMDCWVEEIAITGLGTGSSRPRHSAPSVLNATAVSRLLQGLAGAVGDASHQADGVLADLAAMPGSRVAYEKYDLDLTEAAFEAVGAEVSRKELRQMRAFADLRGKKRLFEIAKAYADCIVTEALPLTEREAQRRNKQALPGLAGGDNTTTVGCACVTAG
ncbi:MAG: patatin-like phospholipase family protein [Pseudomonadota bacterium]